MNKCKNEDPDACHDYYELVTESGTYKLCYEKQGKSKCASSEKLTCPPTSAPTAAPTAVPPSCSDIAGRTLVKKCKKADASECSLYYAWEDEPAGVALLCWGPEGGKNKCSETPVSCALPGYCLPTSAVASTAVVVPKIVGGVPVDPARKYMPAPPSRANAALRSPPAAVC